MNSPHQKFRRIKNRLWKTLELWVFQEKWCKRNQIFFTNLSPNLVLASTTLKYRKTIPILRILGKTLVEVPLSKTSPRSRSLSCKTWRHYPLTKLFQKDRANPKMYWHSRPIWNTKIRTSSNLTQNAWNPPTMELLLVPLPTMLQTPAMH